MDVECEPGCSFSTGSYSDSVRELAGEPGQHPNKLTMARFDVSASLLLLELDLAWVLTLGLGRTYSLLTLRVFFCCCLLAKAAKATSCMVAAPGDPGAGSRV